MSVDYQVLGFLIEKILRQEVRQRTRKLAGYSRRQMNIQYEAARSDSDKTQIR